MNEEDFKDVTSMLVTMGYIMKGDGENLRPSALCQRACEYADALWEARRAEPEPEVGIKAARTRRKKND